MDISLNRTDRLDADNILIISLYRASMAEAAARANVNCCMLNWSKLLRLVSRKDISSRTNAPVIARMVVAIMRARSHLLDCGRS